MTLQSVVAVIVCFIGSLILAHPHFQDLIPNGHFVPNPCANATGTIWHGVGHNNKTGGGIRNVFGVGFMKANFTWTRELCLADSDVDGRSNGVELGDPSCHWLQGEIASYPAIGHPGVCEPMTSDLCMAVNLNVRCI